MNKGALCSLLSLIILAPACGWWNKKSCCPQQPNKVCYYADETGAPQGNQPAPAPQEGGYYGAPVVEGPEQGQYEGAYSVDPAVEQPQEAQYGQYDQYDQYNNQNNQEPGIVRAGEDVVRAGEEAVEGAVGAVEGVVEGAAEGVADITGLK